MADDYTQRASNPPTLPAQMNSGEMNSAGTNSVENELQLLEAIAATPETTQADLAARVGVAVGTVNWYLKRWSKKGYVKVRRIGRWNWSYLLTAEGIARKSQLAGEYLEASLSLYRRTRLEAQRLLLEVVNAGYAQVVLQGEGEIVDICRLTCLELHLEALVGQQGDTPRAHGHSSTTRKPALPILQVEGIQLRLHWPDQPVPNHKPTTKVEESL